MKRNILIWSVFLLLVLSGASYAFNAAVIPSQINPGDAFMIMATGIKGDVMPEALFMGNNMLFSSCGNGCAMAIGAVDIKTKPGRYKISFKSGSRTSSLSLKVKKKRFPVIKLTLPKEKVTLSPDDLARVEAEDRLQKQLWQEKSEKLWRGKFLMPLHHEVSTQYGVMRIINDERESIHRGIDIRGKTGDEVMAANSGRVVLAQDLFFGGSTIILDHGQGIYSVYMHLSKINFERGDSVNKGDVIGLVGSSGRSSGPHLHFGIKISDISVNPLSIIQLGL